MGWFNKYEPVRYLDGVSRARHQKFFERPLVVPACQSFVRKRDDVVLPEDWPRAPYDYGNCL